MVTANSARCLLLLITLELKFAYAARNNDNHSKISNDSSISVGNKILSDESEEIFGVIRGQVESTLITGRPIATKGITYYVNGEGYVNWSKDYTYCEIDQKNYQFWSLSYADGTVVTKVLFSCKGSEKCCELECCSSVSWWIIFLCVVASIGIVIFCCCICSRCKKDEKEITEQVKEESDELLRTGKLNASAQKLTQV